MTQLHIDVRTGGTSKGTGERDAFDTGQFTCVLTPESTKRFGGNVTFTLGYELDSEAELIRAL